jgi:hypothetical protein
LALEHHPRHAIVWAPRASTAGTDDAVLISAPTAREVVDGGGWPAVAHPAPLRPARIAAPRASDLVSGVAVLEPWDAPRPLPRPRYVSGRATASVRPAGIAVAAAATLMVALSAVSGGGGGTPGRAVLAAQGGTAAQDAAAVYDEPTTAAPPATTAPSPPAPAPLPAPAPPPAPPPPPAPAPRPPVSSAGVPAPIPAPSSATLSGATANALPVLSGPHGTDVSYPQCDRDLPVDRNFAIVGVNGGRPFTGNRCLAQQWQWAQAHGAASVYVNVANGAPLDETGSYVYGLQTIDWALGYADSQGVEVPFVWLDVETLNRWNKTNKAVNAQTIRGAIDRLHQRGIEAGVYSTAHQWNVIAGDYRPGVPVWYATGANDGSRAPEKCSPRWSFTGGPVYLVQYVAGNLDRNVTCAAVVPRSAHAFKMKR